MVLVSQMHQLQLSKLVKLVLLQYDSDGAYYITNGPGASSDSITLSMDKDFDNGVSVFASYTGLDAENAWNGTSSQLSSNLEYNPRVDLNECWCW